MKKSKSKKRKSKEKKYSIGPGSRPQNVGLFTIPPSLNLRIHIPFLRYCAASELYQSRTHNLSLCGPLSLYSFSRFDTLPVLLRSLHFFFQRFEVHWGVASTKILSTILLDHKYRYRLSFCASFTFLKRQQAVIPSSSHTK